MKTFDELENIWKKQTEIKPNITSDQIIEIAKKQATKIKRNHMGTLITICITTVILILYFFGFGLYSLSFFSIGLGLMILSLVFRIFFELDSLKKFKKINYELSFIAYSHQITQFYQWRRIIHFRMTPIIYVIYIIGFSLLLPTFQKSFSMGFFVYILISGYGFLIGFIFFMRKKIKEEMKTLDFLKKIHVLS
ncbi:hypothetical protein [Flavobacterium sp. 9AF]|uniref:hypothetical protein n=1 Tax=Flavobacterium sp. 9AF TaxID=2653142 RepID=UPI001359CBFA|nr:hypothetical protein [Flavobacterium sp. 9AF]